MVRIMIGIFLAMILMAAMQPVPPTSARSTQVCLEALAQERASTIRESALRPDVSVPAAKSDPVQGRAVVTFTLQAPSRVVFDFAQPRQNVRSVMVDGPMPARNSSTATS